MNKPSTCKSGGKFKGFFATALAAILMLNLLISLGVHADESEESAFDRDIATTSRRPTRSGAPGLPNAQILNTDPEWTKFKEFVESRQRKEYVDGLSFILSGGLAIVGGQVGQRTASDPIEQGVYALFESIGIASVGYGAYTWKVGGDEQLLYETLNNVRGLSDAGRAAILRSYEQARTAREHRERIVKALTHGMIAAYNIYSATQQTNEPIRNGFYFLGGVNLLACVTYSFTF